MTPEHRKDLHAIIRLSMMSEALGHQLLILIEAIEDEAIARHVKTISDHMAHVMFVADKKARI